MINSFIKLLTVSLIGEKLFIVNNPSWDQIVESLISLNITSKGGSVSLRNSDDTMSMIIFGELGSFHIGIVTEDDNDYVYWNGSKATEAKIPVAGNFFMEHQICRDFKVLNRIVKYFYDTGAKLKDVLWES